MKASKKIAIMLIYILSLILVLILLLTLQKKNVTLIGGEWNITKNKWNSVKHNQNCISTIDYEEWWPPLEIEANRNSIIYDKGFLNYYLDMNYLYRKGFAYYLKSKIKLNEYDLSIGRYKNDDLKTKGTNIYKKYSELNTKNFYIRSFPYIERLSDSDILLLKERVASNNYVIDDTIIKMIRETAVMCYQFAIPETFKWKTQPLKMHIRSITPEYPLNEGGGGPHYKVDKDAIWIMLDECFDTDSSGLKKYIDELRSELEELLGCKVNIVGGKFSLARYS